MRIYDIIQKKRDKDKLTDEEIRFAVDGFTKGDIPDYQMSALLMAIFLNGMDKRELTTLTMAMTESGESVDLSMFGALTADKHSTGGVGDKTTLIVAPIVAALGGKVAKMSGRGLGHTGGTVDKLESIPGYKTTLTREEFISQVEKVGVAVIGQSGHIAPADKKIYALRDVTATVDSIPLIASSIMSKKLAAGSKNIVLDVKFGSGAFMKSVDDAKKLAETMVEIGKLAGRRISAVLTNMDLPLGNAVGNALEVLEAVDVLSGRGSADLVDVCTALAARMACLFGGSSYEESLLKVKDALDSGKALNKFREWIEAQGGDSRFIEDRSLLGTAVVREDYVCPSDGYISHMDAELIGKAASALGAGREKAGDDIDHTAGIILKKKTGGRCSAGEPVAVLYTSDRKRLADARAYLDRAILMRDTKPDALPLIFGVVE
ncbi:thymidine phosphorylase [Sporobacter termitidis DSM 10068]|uniref:Pyrimidine-nucleoside phosphorylase n=1 Tax=Sporobacter termitidis DSM 10068 TaxID=1123282 RepID=A0A1M5TGZ2_9FIRM|nr:thymidine phosphorylase [Sporobacter termitidis]SHH49613.1 thymidine phosphorylase [Sporobacter termitidis DSM 10068]